VVPAGSTAVGGTRRSDSMMRKAYLEALQRAAEPDAARIAGAGRNSHERQRSGRLRWKAASAAGPWSAANRLARRQLRLAQALGEVGAGAVQRRQHDWHEPANSSQKHYARMPSCTVRGRTGPWRVRSLSVCSAHGWHASRIPSPV
jgi:hypothetical protein